MQVGNYDVPENRLETAIQDIKKVYDAIGLESTTSSDLGGIWGYKKYTTGIFYRRLTSIVSYGLLSQVGKGKFQVTKLGESLAHPENTNNEKHSKHQAVLNVSLWKEIFNKHGRNISENSFWVQLKSITDLDPVKAKKLESQIRRWYLDDISFVQDSFEESSQQSQGIRSGTNNTNQMSQQLIPPQFQTDSDNELIQFGKVSLVLPKKDLKKQWDKLQKYMEIYLEDYVEESASDTNTETDNDIESQAEQIVKEEQEKFDERMS